MSNADFLKACQQLNLIRILSIRTVACFSTLKTRFWSILVTITKNLHIKCKRISLPQTVWIWEANEEKAFLSKIKGEWKPMLCVINQGDIYVSPFKSLSRLVIDHRYRLTNWMSSRKYPPGWPPGLSPIIDFNTLTYHFQKHPFFPRYPFPAKCWFTTTGLYFGYRVLSMSHRARSMSYISHLMNKSVKWFLEAGLTLPTKSSSNGELVFNVTTKFFQVA